MQRALFLIACVKKIISAKYEKANDSIFYIYPLSGDEKNEIYLKSKGTIIINGGEYSTNGYTSPEQIRLLSNTK